MSKEDPHILVLNTNTGDVSFIDPANDTVVDTVAVGDDPRDLVYAPAHGRVFITLARSDEVVVLDPVKQRVANEAISGVPSCPKRRGNGWILGSDPRKFARVLKSPKIVLRFPGHEPAFAAVAGGEIPLA